MPKNILGGNYKDGRPLRTGAEATRGANDPPVTSVERMSQKGA